MSCRYMGGGFRSWVPLPLPSLTGSCCPPLSPLRRRWCYTRICYTREKRRGVVDWGRGIGWVWTGAAASGGGGEGSKWGESVRSPPASAAVPLFDRRSPAAAAAAGGGLEVRKKTKKRERERGRKKEEGRESVRVCFFPSSLLRPSVRFVPQSASRRGGRGGEGVRIAGREDRHNKHGGGGGGDGKVALRACVSVERRTATW